MKFICQVPGVFGKFSCTICVVSYTKTGMQSIAVGMPVGSRGNIADDFPALTFSAVQ